VNEHELRLQKEVAWYESGFKPEHILNRWPFYSAKRDYSSYGVAKQRLFAVASAQLPTPEAVLVAPSGNCHDYSFIRTVWPHAGITGIDIAPYSGPEKILLGDILHMPFGDKQFDVIVTTLFFHHVADEGFDQYLKEMFRVARSLVAMEPSRLHPLFIATRSARKVFGNITGQVDHEHPISVTQLAEACRVAGYSSVHTFACSFAHNRLPVPMRPVVNTLRHLAPLKSLAWQMGLIADS